MLIIGVDPDSTAHGIAIYDDGELLTLLKWPLILAVEAMQAGGANALWIIEDVCANKFIYARNTKKGALGLSIAQDIGKVKQAQIELIRFLGHYGIEYKLVKPQKGNWAKNKAQFEKATGWTKRSNEDTRSAAYFGWLYAKKSQ